VVGVDNWSWFFTGQRTSGGLPGYVPGTAGFLVDNFVSVAAEGRFLTVQIGIENSL
jgi:hypothetical protein